MRMAIVDDVMEERKLLRSRLENQLYRCNIHAVISEFDSGEKFLIASKQQGFSVMFLDIYMDEIISRIPEPDIYIQAKVSGVDVRLHLKDIVYAEHFLHMIHIHTINKKILITRQSFKEFVEPLKKTDAFSFVAAA